MSVEAMAWALKQSPSSAVDKLVLVALGNFADDKNQCFPARQTIADMAMCSLDTVDRAIARLASAGLVSKDNRAAASGRQTSNCYTLAVFTTSPHPTTDCGESRRMRLHAQEPHPAAPGPQDAAGRAAQLCGGEGRTVVRLTEEPSLEPSLEECGGERGSDDDGSVFHPHGVVVSADHKIIRHRAFTISVSAIELGIAGRIPAADVATRCLGHALQWAAEIDGGRPPRDVLPSKIANFLSASIMGELNRASSGTGRVRRADSARSAWAVEKDAQRDAFREALKAYQ